MWQAETTPVMITNQPMIVAKILLLNPSLTYCTSPALTGKRDESSAKEVALRNANKPEKIKAIGASKPASPATLPNKA